MKKHLNIIIAVIILAIIVLGVLMFMKAKKPLKNSSTPTTSVNTEEQMIDCSQSTDPQCFLSRVSTCSPVKAAMTSTDGNINIEIAILGIENGKCHFQRKINDALNLDCYFSKENLTGDVIDQTFGNDHGLQEIVDEACKSIVQ